MGTNMRIAVERMLSFFQKASNVTMLLEVVASYPRQSFLKSVKNTVSKPYINYPHNLHP